MNNKPLYSQNQTQIFGEDEFNELKKNPSLVIDKGYEFIERGQYEEALQYFSMGLSLNNDDPDILNGLGITLCELGKLKESVNVLELSIKIDPSNAITLANLAGVCWEMEQYDKAIYYYDKSIELEPDIEDIQLNLINLYMEIGYLYVAFIKCLQFKTDFPKNEEGMETMEDIVLHLAISLY